MFKDKMCKTTVAPSDGLGTTLNNVVYSVIYVTVYRIRLLKFRSNIWLWFITAVQLGLEIRHAGMLCLFFVFLTTQAGLFSSM